MIVHCIQLYHDNYFFIKQNRKKFNRPHKMLNSSAGTIKGVLKVYQQIKVHND